MLAEWHALESETRAFWEAKAQEAEARATREMERGGRSSTAEFERQLRGGAQRALASTDIFSSEMLGVPAAPLYTGWVARTTAAAEAAADAAARLPQASREDEVAARRRAVFSSRFRPP